VAGIAAIAADGVAGTSACIAAGPGISAATGAGAEGAQRRTPSSVAARAAGRLI
jgi:hypothetical protein